MILVRKKRKNRRKIQSVGQKTKKTRFFRKSLFQFGKTKISKNTILGRENVKKKANNTVLNKQNLYTCIDDFF